MAKMLVIGAGEIGWALSEVLCESHDVEVYDTNGTSTVNSHSYDVMNVCYPYSETFVDEAIAYKRIYRPDHTIIHSTVPVGTSRMCGAIHSPVMGMHPNLAASLLTFTKFIGGDGASEVAGYFRQAGMRVYLFDEPETTELMKLLSTLFYSTCIEFTKEVKAQCDGAGVPFSAWTLWTQAYNDGYKRLGREEFARPQLVPIMKKLGGHCLLPNCGLIDDDNDFAKLVERRNRGS